MKKGILCILLSLLLLAPMFASCSQEADLTGTEASIYTLYTIVDEKTTPEAINQVELALNRILFYRLHVILNLEMVTEAEYDKLISAKFEEMEEYQAAKKNNSTVLSESSDGADTSKEIMTGDRILDILEEGKDVPMDEPRLDIFLVRGYDKYYELASQGKLTALDEKLENEAKQLKSYIHSTLFTGAKVDNKTYGIPVNNAIGEYTYLAFDAELLEKYSIDPKTIRSLEDLQGYLETIKANEPNVVPLKNTKASTDIQFLANEGFPALVSNKTVLDAYKNNKLKNYFSMIARYKALGYLADATTEDNADDKTRYAVRIETGTTDEIEKRLEGTGYKYDYSLYSVPVATNETAIDNIFCVSKYVVSNELTDVMKILTAINTDAQLMNLLTYGVENEHYILNDDDQVERTDDCDYFINPDYVGNRFITYTLTGENPNKWVDATNQNKEAIVSPSLGFTSSPKKFYYTTEIEVEDPDNPDKKITTTVRKEISEPDYFATINSVVDKYYPSLMAGTAVQFDYNALYSNAKSEVEKQITEELNNHYIENVLKPMFANKVRDSVIASKSEQLKKDAEESTYEECYNNVVNSLITELTEKFTFENPLATENEIVQMVDDTMTDEYIDENFGKYYPEEAFNELVNSVYESLIEIEISDAVEKIIGTSEYNKEYSKLVKSDKYQKDLNDRIKYDAPAKILAKVDEKISEEIAKYTDKMYEDINVALETSVNEFITENKEILALDDETILLQIGYLVEKEVEIESDTETSEGETDEETKTEIIREPKYETWYEFVFEDKVKAVYYKIFGEPA